jgi:hypothetical protein
MESVLNQMSLGLFVFQEFLLGFRYVEWLVPEQVALLRFSHLALHICLLGKPNRKYPRGSFWNWFPWDLFKSDLAEAKTTNAQKTLAGVCRNAKGIEGKHQGEIAHVACDVWQCKFCPEDMHPASGSILSFIISVVYYRLSLSLFLAL